jgi:LysM repeat protein
MRFALCARRAACLVGVLSALLLGSAPVAFAQQAASGVHVVEEGDTLYSIAQAHDLSVARLRSLNGLDGNAIYPGQELRVRPPGSETSGSEAPDSEAEEPGAKPRPSPAPDTSAAGEGPAAGTPLYGAHTAQTGATLYRIAARYGTPVDSLVALNDSLLASGGVGLRPGTEVRLPASLGPPAHTVEEGETIYDVARQYGVSAVLLQRTNDLTEKEVRPGQRLRLPGREAPQPQPRGTRRPVHERGPVARYPASYEGRLMAGGARYDPERYVVSHPSLPIGTVVLLTNPENGRQTFARVADRGPLDETFVMDGSAAVHERLGLGEARSDQPVTVQVMD